MNNLYNSVRSFGHRLLSRNGVEKQEAPPEKRSRLSVRVWTPIGVRVRTLTINNTNMKNKGNRYSFPSEANRAIAFICVNGNFIATPELREKYAQEGTGDMALEYRSRRGSEYARNLMFTKQFSDAAVAWFRSHFKFAEVKPGKIGVVKNSSWDGRHTIMADALKDIRV